ncbi:hypothetical protein ACIBAH_04015 [Streptomyces sp. NPDC051445]|uniref:hypothetical protein n=1 Tax=Streptomyces sp. NPDC051445 TaxID=3365653 RepID=UPI0037B0F350
MSQFRDDAIVPRTRQPGAAERGATRSRAGHGVRSRRRGGRRHPRPAAAPGGVR